MKKVIVEYDNGVISTYDIVNFRSYKKGKKEVLEQDLKDLINHFSVKSYKFVEPLKKEVKKIIHLQLIFQKIKKKIYLCL